MTFTRHIVRGTTALLVGVVVLAAIAIVAMLATGHRPQPVLSGSMEPTMPVGSLVIAKAVPAESVEVGDVVTFQNPQNASQTVTHRIAQIRTVSGERRYWTKGDANPRRDPWVLNLPGKVGERVATVPYAGYAALYAARPAVRGGAIALTCLLLLIAFLRSVWRDERPAPTAAPAPAAPIRWPS